MAPQSAHLHDTMTLLSERPIAPIPIRQQVVNRIYPVSQALPFDFGATLQPRLTLPNDLKAFHYPPDQITLTEGATSPPPCPLKNHTRNPVFFTDQTLKEETAKFFGHFTVHRNCGDVDTITARRTSQTQLMTFGFHTVVQHTLSYIPHDDDLLEWRKQLNRGEDDRTDDGKVELAPWATNGTWPPWNFRFDLEL